MSDRTYPKYYSCDEPTIDLLSNFCRRADDAILSLFGPRSASPHGFYQPTSFVEAQQRNARRNGLRSLLIIRYIKQAIRKNILKATPHPLITDAFLVRVVN